MVVFRSDDNGVALEGRFVAFDGTHATLLLTSGPATFRVDGMSCDGVACPDLEAFTPTFRVVADERLVTRLLLPLIEAYLRDTGLRPVETNATIIELSDEDRAKIAFDVRSMTFDEALNSFEAHRVDALITSQRLGPDTLAVMEAAGLGQLERGMQARVLALDAVVPVASPFSGRTEISMSELVSELASKGQFELHASRDTVALLNGFERQVMALAGEGLRMPDVTYQNHSELVAGVANAETALALVPFGNTGLAQPLRITGPCGVSSEATFLSLKSEDYPLTLPVMLYLPQRAQHPEIEAFLNWLRSPAAQLVIRRAGFADMAASPVPLADQGDRLANAILQAGSDVELGELQRMVRVLKPRIRMSTTFRFEPGSTRLDGPSRSNILQLAQSVRDGRFSGRDLMLVGFSDARGPALANRDLASARAEAVRRALLAALAGAVPENVLLQTESFGEALPMACDDTVWGQQINRRVELWVRDLD
ncbi:MAG: OmpA family protein [Pseudomonadota bacterium]